MSKAVFGCLCGLAMLSTACGTTAAISRTNAAPVEGKILRSDKDSLFVQTMGGEMAIPRSEVTDIDHPGNGAAITGGVLGAYGLLNIATGLPHCDTQGSAYCTGVFAPAAIGIPLLIYGLVVWRESKDVVSGMGSTASASLPVMVAPLATEEGGEQYTGAALVASF